MIPSADFCTIGSITRFSEPEHRSIEPHFNLVAQLGSAPEIGQIAGWSLGGLDGETGEQQYQEHGTS